MLAYRLKEFIKGLASCCIMAAVLFLLWITTTTRFSAIEGERTFYVGSASSQAQMQPLLQFKDFGQITGESVTFLRGKKTAEEILAQVQSLYDMEVVFTECVGGTTSYYGYTEQWLSGVQINGVFINLHVAIGEELCAIGAPLIFGGF